MDIFAGVIAAMNRMIRSCIRRLRLACRTTATGLMDLPVELRLQIYMLVCNERCQRNDWHPLLRVYKVMTSKVTSLPKHFCLFIRLQGVSSLLAAEHMKVCYTSFDLCESFLSFDGADITVLQSIQIGLDRAWPRHLQRRLHG